MGSLSCPAVKICGLTDPEQALAIAQMGVEAIGVIGVAHSPRYLADSRRSLLFSTLSAAAPALKRVWVVADPNDDQIASALNAEGSPTVIQLHGQEAPERCGQLRRRYPQTEWWKALRVRHADDLQQLKGFSTQVDALLLDAWSPEQLGGTGQRLPLSWINSLRFDLPWWLAGGISSEWIPEVLQQVSPSGLDASSRLEVSPGIKDLQKVKALVEAIRLQRE